MPSAEAWDAEDCGSRGFYELLSAGIWGPAAPNAPAGLRREPSSSASSRYPTLEHGLVRVGHVGEVVVVGRATFEGDWGARGSRAG